MLEAYGIVEFLDLDGTLALADVVAGGEYPVNPLHRGKALGDVVGGLGKVLDRLDDAVQYHHIEDEGRGVDEGFVLDYQISAEAEHYRNHSRSQELADGMGQGLAGGDAGVLCAHRSGYLVEAGGHSLLGQEGLDDAQPSQSLLHIVINGHHILKAYVLSQSLLHHAHSVAP